MTRLSATENQSTKHSSSTNPQSKTVFGLKKPGGRAPPSPIPTKTLELNIEEKTGLPTPSAVRNKANARVAQSVGKKPQAMAATKHTAAQKSPPTKLKDMTATKRKDGLDNDALLISKQLINQPNKEVLQRRARLLGKEAKSA